ncbi:MAG: phosphorylase [Cyanothece sp. SIO1E1]|nr:phosphorylase [Cyanothece sp. SIO1E1]
MSDQHPIAPSPSSQKLLLAPGTLWSQLAECTQHALQCGALHTIPTAYELVEHGGIQFIVRILANLVRKEKAQQKQAQAKATSGKAFNPFLPYETDLFVTDISATHLCLLNKFNVVDHHLLIVTRAFEDQDSWLNWLDFEALWACMAEFEGLAFYNGGKLAGASQRHKHLQLVPLPIVPEGPAMPIEAAIASTQFTNGMGTVPAFPFVHAIAPLDPDSIGSTSQAAATLLANYQTLLRAVGLLPSNGSNPDHQTGPYNLLVTRRWMMVVRRSQEQFASISVNSLGFAGSLLVRDTEQMQLLKRRGPMTILSNVACSNP